MGKVDSSETVTILERRRKLLIEHIDVLQQVFKSARQRGPFNLDGIVILPDHLQLYLDIAGWRG